MADTTPPAPSTESLTTLVADGTDLTPTAAKAEPNAAGDKPATQTAGPEPETYAHRRDPPQEIIPSRHRKHVQLTDAQKATRQISRDAGKARKKELMRDLDAHLLDFDVGLVDIAHRHKRSVKYIKHLLKTSSAFKKKRAPTLQNALLHYKSVEVNQGGRLLFSNTLH